MMKSARPPWAATVVVLALSCCPLVAAEPVAIEKGVAQFFIDDLLIDSSQDLVRTLHQPKKDHGGNKPILQMTGGDFEKVLGTLEANGSIVYDPKIRKYVQFAIAYCPSVPEEMTWSKVRLCRFESDDGLEWGPGEWIFPRSREDFFDPDSKSYATNMDLFSCYYSPEDSEYPYQGWCWYANWGDEREGAYFVKSKDGFKWERGNMVIQGYGGEKDPSKRVIRQDNRTLAGAGDVTVFYKDPEEPRFLALVKFFSVEEVPPGNRLRCRAYGFFEDLSAPFDLNSIGEIALLPKAAQENGDEPYDEYYGSTAWRYGSVWLGGLKVWHGKGDYPYSAAGCAYLKLAVSRDGLKWAKVPFPNDDGIPEVFIPNGPEGGNDGLNDGGYMTDISTGPLRIGDELMFYYGSSSYGKNHPQGIRVSGGGIFRARLRIDGFVSVDGGTVTTKPLKCDGGQLTTNSVGAYRVEALSADGENLGTAEVEGDSLTHEVTFSGKSLGDMAAGKPVRLRFSVSKGGQLYSFTVH